MENLKNVPLKGRELPIMPKGFIRGRLYENDVLVALIIRDGQSSRTNRVVRLSRD